MRRTNKTATVPVGEELLTVREVATVLNVHHNTVRRWVAQGYLSCIRVGPRGDRRFRRGDIEVLVGRSGIWTDSTDVGMENLTDCQRRVLRSLLRGKTNPETARETGLTLASVRGAVVALRLKFSAKSKAELRGRQGVGRLLGR